VTQRQILENALDLLATLRGPAKILIAGSGVPMPTSIEQVINPSNGAPAASWTSFGITRGGINVVKNIDQAVRDDIDQILGAYDQDVTDRNYQITTQIGQVLASSDQLAIALALDPVPTVLQNASANGIPTQIMRMLDDGANKTPEYRMAVVYPKPTPGKVLMYVFRRSAVAGGEKTIRFDKNDPASPGLEMRMFPEIATTIDSKDAYGRMYEHI
jgi:hypothetical protein